ncbi:MAG: glycine zipper 2TM domain-containing protein [Pseudomonadales bacterium]|jgi:uncharacterized protein YcfJ|nr:glycine zipper 2TM domain-containing protein [Pseudomonadales bacterium]
MKDHTGRSLVRTALASGLLGCASFAAADHAGVDRYGANGFYTWVDVVDVDPVYAHHYVDEPIERCYDLPARRQQPVRYQARDRYSYAGVSEQRRGGDAGATLLGGVIGGVLGHAIGDGRGKPILTVAGAAIGAAVANNASRDRFDSRRYDDRYDVRDWPGRDRRGRNVRRQSCEIVYESRRETTFEGYDVVYRYRGQEFTRRLDENPGDRLRIRVDVEPVI